MSGEQGLRPRVSGKFIQQGEDKLFVRGVTYGTFKPRDSGEEYPEPDTVERDFTMMAANGFNAIRTYTSPPRWLMDAALRHNLYVLVGVPMERYTGFLTDRKNAPDLLEIMRESLRECIGHPAVLCYAVGNEIPASVDLTVYHSMVKNHWPNLNFSTLEKLAGVGRVFCQVAAIDWASMSLEFPWPEKAITSLEIYHEGLSETIQVKPWAG